MTEQDVGRIPLQMAQIDLDRCANTYGVAPCTASLGVTGDDKCFECRATCQDPVNYDPSDVYTITLAKPQSQAPYEDRPTWPFLKSASTKPTRINPAAGDKDWKALGRRATATLTVSDAPDPDLYLDPYVTERAYDPYERGTFWTKLRARHPYYQGRPMRIYDGYVGQSLAEMNVRHYVIEEIKGPQNGTLQIMGHDILKLADNDRAQFPPTLDASLAEDIDAIQTTIKVNIAQSRIDDWVKEVEPGGSRNDKPYGNGVVVYKGDAIYDPGPPVVVGFLYSGYIIIGEEIIFFDDSFFVRDADGAITLENCQRGVLGSTADDHEADDEVQPVGGYQDQPCYLVAREILEIWGEIPASFIPYDTEWTSEGETWLAPFNVTGYVTEPTGVDKIVGELNRDCMFFIWWDERQQEIKMKALRPPTETIREITFDNSILRKSTTITEKPDQRISRLYLYYLQRNKAEKIDEAVNFRRLRAEIDNDAESPAQYGEKRIERFYSRWLQNDAQVLNVAVRYLTRYRDNPRYFSCELDAVNRDLWVGDVVRITHYDLVDVFGEPIPTLFQIISAEEVESGTRIRYELQDYEYTTKFAYWMEEGAPAYVDATDEERQTGFWWADDDGKLPDGSDGYNWS